jgi:hypothetical protein
MPYAHHDCSARGRDAVCSWPRAPSPRWVACMTPRRSNASSIPGGPECPEPRCIRIITSSQGAMAPRAAFYVRRRKAKSEMRKARRGSGAAARPAPRRGRTRLRGRSARVAPCLSVQLGRGLASASTARAPRGTLTAALDSCARAPLRSELRLSDRTGATPLLSLAEGELRAFTSIEHRSRAAPAAVASKRPAPPSTSEHSQLAACKYSAAAAQQRAGERREAHGGAWQSCSAFMQARLRCTPDRSGSDPTPSKSSPSRTPQRG